MALKMLFSIFYVHLHPHASTSTIVETEEMWVLVFKDNSKWKCCQRKIIRFFFLFYVSVVFLLFCLILFDYLIVTIDVQKSK